MMKRDYPEKNLSVLISEFDSTLKEVKTLVSRFLNEASVLSSNNNSKSEAITSVDGALDVLYDVYEQLFELEDVAENASGFMLSDEEEKAALNVIRVIRKLRENVDSLQKIVKNYFKVTETPLASLAREELTREVAKFSQNIEELNRRGEEFLRVVRLIFEKAKVGRLP